MDRVSYLKELSILHEGLRKNVLSLVWLTTRPHADERRQVLCIMIRVSRIREAGKNPAELVPPEDFKFYHALYALAAAHMIQYTVILESSPLPVIERLIAAQKELNKAEPLLLEGARLLYSLEQ